MFFSFLVSSFPMMRQVLCAEILKHLLSMLTAHVVPHTFGCRCLVDSAFMERQFPVKLFSWALSSLLVCPWQGAFCIADHLWGAIDSEFISMLCRGAVSLVWRGLQALKEAKTSGMKVGAGGRPR